MIYKKIKILYYLSIFKIVYTNNTHSVLDNEWLSIFDNVLPVFDNKDLETIVLECYKFINNSYILFKQDKVSAIYSYNKEIISNLLKKNNHQYEIKYDLTQLYYQDNIKLFYIAGKTFPFNKYMSLIFMSDKRMNIIKNINNNLYVYLMEIFNKPNIQLKINKNVFDIIYLDEKNPQFQNIKKLYLGKNKIEFSFTRMEDIILKQSFKDKFLWQYDNLLPTINLILYFYIKSLSVVEDSKWYDSIKNFILNNNIFPKNNSLSSVVQNIPHYIFDENNEEIKGSIKQEILDSYLLRLIYYVYLYIY